MSCLNIYYSEYMLWDWILARIGIPSGGLAAYGAIGASSPITTERLEMQIVSTIESFNI